MERSTIVFPDDDTVDTVVVEVQQLEGGLNLYLKHDFGEGAVLLRDLDKVGELISSMQMQLDDLRWQRADKLVKEALPGAKAWRAEWVAYDDMNGGSWSPIAWISADDYETAFDDALVPPGLIDPLYSALEDLYDSPVEGSWCDGGWRKLES